MWVGIEIGNLGTGNPDGTLYGDFYSTVENTFSTVDAYFASTPSYAGIVIDKWSALQPLQAGAQIKTPIQILSPVRVLACH
jgi:hypothetical protein